MCKDESDANNNSEAAFMSLLICIRASLDRVWFEVLFIHSDSECIIYPEIEKVSLSLIFVSYLIDCVIDLHLRALIIVV